jgi:putative DNA primase/helicase
MAIEKIDLARIDWYAILPKLGVDSVLIGNPRRTGPCPIEGGDGKTRFRFQNKDGRGNWHCSQCGHGDGVRLVALVNGCSDADAIRLIKNDGRIEVNGRRELPQRHTPLVAARDPVMVKRSLQRTWDAASGVGATFAQTYLQRRVPGLQMAWLSTNLRAHKALYHYDEQTKRKSHHPGLVARVLDARGVPVTLHRTYLSIDGFKAPVSIDQVKKQMTGVRGLNGDAIRLNIPFGSTRVLIVCEGIETGLALVAATGNRHEVWALLDAGNLAKARIPRERFDMVVIAADRDPMNPKHGWRVGEHYAQVLEDRLKSEGFGTRVRVPEDEGKDFCDVWNDKYRLKLVA